MKRIIVIAALMLAAACREEAPVPEAVTMTDEALGYYCQMILVDHEGPKAQVHLTGADQPIFFSQVRDGIAYLREPEKTAEIRAFYVSNMSRAESWANPGRDNWILADDAYFVVGSDAVGGMGAPELVPFETETDATAYAAAHGGMVMRLAGIPAEAVLGGVEHGQMDHHGMEG